MNSHRLRQFLALFLVLCMLCSTTLPIYAETSTGEVTPVETSVSVATPENAASDAGTEKSPADTSSLPSATTETALSEAAQAFVDAVAALDRESILTAINAWGLASQAWQADQSNAELTAALEAATEASDAAAAPVYAAEDLYMALSDEEREIDAVKAAYSSLTALVWFNGVEAYCCDNGLYAAPGGCPTYSFAYVSKLEPGQYTPGNHYANQINIWGGLNQLSLGLLSKSHDANDFAGSSFAASAATTYATTGNDVLKTAYEYYNDTQLWIIEHYPNSVAAQTYLNSISALSGENVVTPYVNPGDNGYYTYAYFPPAGYNWQRIVVVDLNPISDDDDTSGLPDVPEMQYYSADWTAPPQSASGSFDLTYTVHIDKSANITHEKLDDAIFKLTPNPSSGTISGGTWTIGDPQIVTTVDGAASATWTLHYEVTKTSTTTLSGKEGPYNTQEEANAAAEAAKNNAIAQLQNEAQAMVDAAIAEAKAQLAKITIDYEETTVPHGFDPTDSSSGSVSVPSNGSATAVVANQPWQAHVTWEKRDALTGGRITEDAEYAFYEWNADANEYEISSNYRVTRLENGLYTVTVTNPVYTDWTEGYVYYTQDNLGKFRIEEVTAPAGYTDAALQGTDWVEHWSQEFEITDSDQTYSYTGDDADYNRPQGNKVIIKKIEAHTGEIIVDDAVLPSEKNSDLYGDTRGSLLRHGPRE